MHSYFFLCQMGQPQLQTAISFLIGLAFLASILVVGSIWVLKRSPSVVSILLYGLAFLLLCLPMLGLATQTQERTRKFKAVAIPFEITAVRAIEGTKSVSIAPFGDINEGDMLLEASSPMMDAQLQNLMSKKSKLEFDRQLVAEDLPLPGQGQLFSFGRSEEEELEELKRQRERQYLADIQVLERLRLPILREISRLKVELKHATEDAEQFNSLLTRGLASSAEYKRKQKALEKISVEMTSYQAQLASIDDQLTAMKSEISFPKTASVLDNDASTVANIERKMHFIVKDSETAKRSMAEDLKATRLEQIDLQLKAVEIEIDSVRGKQGFVAPHDGVVVWKHPSPDSTLPGTPLVAMSRPGRSGVLLKVNVDDLENLQIDTNSEISIEIIDQGYPTKESRFQAKCIAHNYDSEHKHSGICELLVISPLPATLFQRLLNSDVVPLEVVFKGNADTKSQTLWQNLVEKVDFTGYYYEQAPTASE